MCVNLLLRGLRSAPVLALLFLPFVAAPARAQSSFSDQELTKLRAEVQSLRQQLGLKEQALARASADIGTARAELTGDKAALIKAQADLTRARNALAEADAARTVLRRDLSVEQAAHKVELTKIREEAAVARKALTDAISARDTAVRDLAAVIDRAARMEKECQLEKAELSGTREKLGLAEAELALMHRELEKSRLHLSDVSFPCQEHGKARFVIEVPAPDVEIYVAGKRLDVIDGKVVREFTTTPLETGKRYTLSLQAKVMRDGKMLSTTRQVIFKADNEYRLYLDPCATPSGGQ